MHGRGKPRNRRNSMDGGTGKTQQEPVSTGRINRRLSSERFVSIKTGESAIQKQGRTRTALEQAAGSWAGRQFTVSAHDRKATAAADEINELADAKTLTELYAAYYKDKKRVPVPEGVAALQSKLYESIGEGPSDYLRTPFSQEALNTLVSEAAGKGYTVTVQGSLDNDPQKALRDELPKPGGDYVKFENAQSPLPDNDKAQQGIARRIIVDLKTQGPTMDIANALVPLFKDGSISPFFRQFKIKLSTAAEKADAVVKYDKIVIYYTLGQFTENGHDKVGDRITEAIMSAAKEADFDSRAAPFFCRVAPGIYWAEEPKYHSKLTGSFTQSRAAILAEVIGAHDEIPDSATFIDLVTKALAEAAVDKDHPYLHQKQGTPTPLGPLPPHSEKL